MTVSADTFGTEAVSSTPAEEPQFDHAVWCSIIPLKIRCDIQRFAPPKEEYLMMDFLARVEASGFSTWVRESPSLLAFPLILSLHTLGLGLIVGSNVVLD